MKDLESKISWKWHAGASMDFSWPADACTNDILFLCVYSLHISTWNYGKIITSKFGHFMANGRRTHGFFLWNAGAHMDFLLKFKGNSWKNDVFEFEVTMPGHCHQSRVVVTWQLPGHVTKSSHLIDSNSHLGALITNIMIERKFIAKENTSFLIYQKLAF